MSKTAGSSDKKKEEPLQPKGGKGKGVGLRREKGVPDRNQK